MGKKRKASDSSSSDDDRREKKRRKHSSSHKDKEKRRSSRDEKDSSGKTFEKISDSDYFLKNTEFQVWVFAHEGKTFDQLSSHDSRKLFSKFVKRWNKRKLPEKFYQGINETEIDSSHRTKHKWSFTMDRSERDQLASTKDAVDSETHHRKFAQNFGAHHPLASSSSHPPSSSATSANAIEVAPIRTKVEKNSESDEDQKYAERKEKTKKYNQYKKLVEEELVPKETGREARLEKKKVERERRRKDDSPERDERDIYGGDDDFKARLAARKRAMEAKKVERAENLEKARANYEAKEDDKMQAFRDLVASGQFTKL